MSGRGRKGSPLSKRLWTERIIDSRAAKTGGVVRRKTSSVFKYGNEPLLKAIVKAKGFRLIKSGSQFVVFCSDEPVTVVV